MQNILSFVPTTNAAPATPISSETAKSESGDGSFSESFFSMILGQYAKDEEETTQSTLTLPVSAKEEETPELATTGEAKSIDEHLLGDLLSIINALQKDPQTTTFPTLNASSSLEKLVASEATRQEFANVKSVSDLMNLSQKYNLGLEKISVSKESLQSLKTQFPELDKGNFFKDLQTALTPPQPVTNSDATTLKANAITFLDKQATTPTPQNVTPTPSILGELIAKNSTPKESNVTPQTPNDQVVETATIEENPLVVDDKQRNTQALQEETTQEGTSKPLETVIQKVANTNETKKTQPSTQKESVSAPLIDETPAQTTPTLKVSDGKAQEDKTDKNESADTLLKAAKSDKVSDDVTEGEIAQSQKVATHDDEKSTSSSDETHSSIDVKGDVKTAPLKQEINTKPTTTKESLSQFASDLQEKIETYKPPIMKVELSLSPKSLGDVDVTLLTRGNNLHVNISSTTTTMSLFTKNQDDVRSALINMGFTNLEMNFSDQSNKEQAQQNQKNSRGDSEFTTEQAEEETTTLEIVIPQYV